MLRWILLDEMSDRCGVVGVLIMASRYEGTEALGCVIEVAYVICHLIMNIGVSYPPSMS